MIVFKENKIQDFKSERKFFEKLLLVYQKHRVRIKEKSADLQIERMCLLKL